MIVTPAFAQATAGAQSTDVLLQFLQGPVPMLALIVVIFYFLLFRPQRQQLKQHREMLKNIRRGDTIVTNGGLIGKVAKVVDDTELQVEIAEGTRVRIARPMVAEVRARGEPVKDEG